MAILKVRLLGTFDLRDAADRPMAVLSKKNRGLLAILAFQPFVSRQKLASLLWSDRGDAQARGSLRQALASLRRDLGPAHEALIAADDEKVSLDQSGAEIDAVAFQHLANSEDAEELRRANALYRGELLEDETISDPSFTDWVAMERARLHDLAVAALERLWALETEGARLNAAKRLVALEPLKEFSHQALMLSHAEMGEDALALQHYTLCRNLLKAELGIAPGREIEALRQKLMSGMSVSAVQDDSVGGEAARRASTDNGPSGLPDKPSIAVLPFQNLSGDPEQDYFADGVVEEVIIALSRLQWLFVIARNSSFAYRGRSTDMKRIGRELGVRYLLDGSIRKSADRVRMTGQLIDATTGAHIWADRFEGKLEDIFALQDQMTVSVVGQIAPRLEQAEIERVERKPTESLDAYDHFLRGLANLHKWTKAGNEVALKHFYRAIELDPNYASAHGLAARTFVQRNAGGWIIDHPSEAAEAERLARRAAALGQDNAVALSTAAFALCDLAGAMADADAFVERALKLNPNLATAWLFSGWVKVAKGEAERALEHLTRARQLSPNDPEDFSVKAAMAFAHFVAGRYNEGLDYAESAERTKPNFLFAILVGAACAALAKRPDVAAKAMGRVLHINPVLQISKVGTIQVMRPEDFARWTDGLRKAGLPE